MKKMLVELAGLLPVLSVGAVTVTGQGKSAALDFAAKDLERVLAGVEGTIAFEKEASLRSQEWRLKTADDGRLVISGCDDMGIVYGVYTFLEKHVGCAWYAPDTEFVPKLDGYKLPTLDETGRPTILYREHYLGGHDRLWNWRLRNKESHRTAFGIGVRVGKGGDCHSFARYEKEVRKTHPELFDKKPAANGGLCKTFCCTDPATHDAVAEEMMKWIAEDRAAVDKKGDGTYPTIYDLSQDDGPSWGECRCADCDGMAKREGSYSGPMTHFANEVAKRVHAKYPDVVVRTFAYSYTQTPPKTVKALPYVNIRLCNSSIFNPLLRGEERGDELEEWGRHASSIGIWGWWRTFSGKLYPFVMSPRRIGEEMRFCRDNGVITYFAENETPLERSFAMMQHWLFLKLAENPDLDYKELANRFLRAYYGKAARPVAEYLGYLSRRQEKTREYLDRAFFEEANRLLSEAEALVADDERSRMHVLWERSVVDRAMYVRLTKLIKAGYAYDKEASAKRFKEANEAIIGAWEGFKPYEDTRQKALKVALDEAELYSHFPVDIPERFRGLDVEDFHWNLNFAHGEPIFVDDPDAAAGKAFWTKKDRNALPYDIHFYCGSRKEGDTLSFTSREEVPQDEKFHYYRIGRGVVQDPFNIYFNNWEFYTCIGTIGIIPEARDVWVSVKFQGPNFVTGSTKENRVLFDRILLVKNDDILRGYEVTGPSYVKNGTFEKGLDGWETDVRANVSVDPNGGHNGAALKAKGNPDGWMRVCVKMGEAKDFTGDLLVRGWCKYEEVDPRDPYMKPFCGLWAMLKDGNNDFNVSTTPFFMGNSGWQKFERIVNGSTLRRNVEKAAAKGRELDLTFRLNLSKQPGTVWLDDVEVLPIRRKAE